MPEEATELTPHDAGIRIKCRRDDFGEGIQFLLTKRTPDENPGDTLVVDKILLRSRQSDQFYYSKPTFQLDPGAAQSLMDSLWECGLRPTDGKGSAGQLVAVENHLADMKKIAFDLLAKQRSY